MVGFDPLCPILDYTKSLGSVHLPYIILPLMQIFKAKTCIEIGIYNGFVTQTIAEGLAALNPDGSGVLISCDIREECRESAKYATEGLPIQFKFICADSATIDWKNELTLMGRSECDFASIDGNHEEVAAVDIKNIASITKHLGIMCIHDYAPALAMIVSPAERLLRTGEWGRIIIPEDDFPENVAAAIFQKIEMRKRPNSWHRLTESPP